MARIKYTCKNCGWSRSVPAQWADIKPKRCMNAKCNTSFTKEPDKLNIDDPTRKSKKVESKVAFKGKPNKLESRIHEEADSKPKKRSKPKQQQVKEEEKVSS